MKRRILKSPRARILALAAGVAALGSLATAPAGLAAGFTPPTGQPLGGTNCVAQDGKISGRGSTLQLWLQYDLMGAYAGDVCGPVASQGSNDITHPASPLQGSPLYTGPNTYSNDWMLAYNYFSAQQLGSSGANSAVGSGSGETAIGCFAEAFAGTDIPVTGGQLTKINNGTFDSSEGSPPVSGIGSNGKFCNPKSSTTSLTTPFTPQPQFPNPGDTESASVGGLSPSGVMVFPIGISAVSIFANLPSSCVPSGGLHLSNNDMLNIWGGTYTNWNQVTDAGIVAGSTCTTTGGLAITRVARNDNSGTTQSFDNYLASIGGYNVPTPPALATGICGTGDANATSWKALQNNQANGTSGGNVHWPTGSGCSTLVDNESPGGPALINSVEGTSGAIGYADLSDAQNDTNGFQSSIAGNTIAEFGLTPSTGGSPVSPRNGQGSNCTTTASLPSGSPVGLGGTWNLTAQTAPNQTVDDISYAKEGSSYPECSLTWDFAWTGDDGNIPNEEPLPSTNAATAAGASTISLDSTTIAGLPNSFTSSGSESVTVPATGGTDTISWTGYNTSTNSLTGVTGDTFPIPTGTQLSFPNGTGGPEANLTPDQRRTLYSYYSYVLSPAAQATESGAGYQSLPAAWLQSLRSGFQANY